MNTDNHLAFCISLIVTFISFRSIPRAPMMWPASQHPPAYKEFSLRSLATQRRRDAPRGTYPGPNALPEDVPFLSSTATHNSPQRCWRVIEFLLCCPKVGLENSAEQNPEDLAAPKCVGQHASLPDSNHYCNASTYFAQIGRGRCDCVEIANSAGEVRGSICTELVG